MSSEPEPKWVSEDPQNWSTYWEAWYQIGNADAVLVNGYVSREAKAAIEAESALQEALEKVKDLGLSVEGVSWTRKIRSRSQKQTWPNVTVKEYVVAKWYGTLSVVLKSLIKQGEAIERRRD